MGGRAPGWMKRRAIESTGLFEWSFWVGDAKTGGDPSFGISLGDVLRLPKRHPACRWREAQPGSCTERENLDGDAKGKSTSGYNREAESTDAPARGGLLRSSDEAG
jgi:hypothetical protein